MRLTEELLKRQPRPKAGQKLLWDELVTGFGVRLTPTRTAFVVQYRENPGRKVRRSIGHWPNLSVDSARRMARVQLGQASEQAATGGGATLREAMRTWFDRQTADWRPRYRVKVDRMLALYVEGVPSDRVKLTPTAMAAIAELGCKPVAAVRRTDVLRVVDALKRGAADQFMAILSSFFGWAIEREMTESNPARNRLRVTGGRRVRNRALTDPELVAVWRAFAGEGEPHVSAFQLLVLTGARRREVTGMRWDELDLDAGTWTLPPERRKGGRRDPSKLVITLAPQALAAIERQPRLEGSTFVFWGRRDRSQYDFQNALLDRVMKAAKIPNWRLHDLRRTARSGMARLGISQVVAELCLGHNAKPGLVGVYDAHDYADEMKAAWIKWARHIKRITN